MSGHHPPPRAARQRRPNLVSRTIDGRRRRIVARREERCHIRRRGPRARLLGIQNARGRSQPHRPLLDRRNLRGPGHGERQQGPPRNSAWRSDPRGWSPWPMAQRSTTSWSVRSAPATRSGFSATPRGGTSHGLIVRGSCVSPAPCSRNLASAFPTTSKCAFTTAPRTCATSWSPCAQPARNT